MFYYYDTKETGISTLRYDLRVGRSGRSRQNLLWISNAVNDGLATLATGCSCLVVSSFSILWSAYDSMTLVDLADPLSRLAKVGQVGGDESRLRSKARGHPVIIMYYKLKVARAAARGIFQATTQEYSFK